MAKIAKIVTITIGMVMFLLVFCAIGLKLFLPSLYFKTNVGLEFPSYEDGELNEKQILLIELARSTFGEKKPESFYDYVPMDEPWCANYVSYLYKEIGMPFVNPVSGGWRIPGIYTLKDYLVLNGFWRGMDYAPVVGDIVIYDNGIFGGHTNLVLKVDGGEIVTIGGNEGGAIRIQRFDYNNPIYGLVGFGHIISE